MKAPKYTRFQDIPQFTRNGSYRVDVSWDFLEEQIEHWDERDHGSPVVTDPDFQRGHVWTEDKQREYVEYILRGGRSSKTIYWNCSTWGRGYNTPLELVDGKQRLEAARKFMRNELVIFGNCRYESFTDRLRVTSASFEMVINDLPTRGEVLQWYLDLNTGGVVHTTEEIEKVRKLLLEELNK